jgi:flagellar biosynthesis protein FlhB
MFMIIVKKYSLGVIMNYIVSSFFKEFMWIKWLFANKNLSFIFENFVPLQSGEQVFSNSHVILLCKAFMVFWCF